MSDSPYEPMTRTDSSDAKLVSNAEPIPNVEPVPVGELQALLPFAQLGLRLLGVMFVVEGVGAMFGGLTQGFFQARAYIDAGYAVPIDPTSAGWIAGGVPQLIAGLYFILGGNWVLLNVFAAARDPNDRSTESEDDVGTNLGPKI